MASVKSGDTVPEMVVRSLIHSLGFRFRLHRCDLPGKPDIVLSRHRKVVFVHGCFWHGHGCQRGSRVPKTNTEYWVAKIDKNVIRDRKSVEQLRAQGWESLIIWECEIRKRQQVLGRIQSFLNG